jgi:membrane-associated protease RseP (regulator of RpoE activity)
MKRTLVHLTLFLATFVSMTLAFYLMPYRFDRSVDALLLLARGGADRYAVQDSLLFAGSALLILLSHEMGHYLMARQYGVESSLPYFIPVPFGFGTMGAVIRLKGTIPSRNALFDIGAGGPLAGLAVALPLLVVGVMVSTPVPCPSIEFPGSLSLWSFAAEAGKAIRHWLDGTTGAPLTGVPVELFGDNLLTLGVSRLVWGKLPPGVDLNGHPVFIAAWFGLLVTMFNLLPAGQLDGGHVVRAVFGPRAEHLGPHVASLLLVLALLCSVTWLIWFAMLVRVIGFGHPPPVDDDTPLSRGRVVASVVVWVLTVLCFMPVPIDVATM